MSCGLEQLFRGDSGIDLGRLYIVMSQHLADGLDGETSYSLLPAFARGCFVSFAFQYHARRAGVKA